MASSSKPLSRHSGGGTTSERKKRKHQKYHDEKVRGYHKLRNILQSSGPVAAREYANEHLLRLAPSVG